MIWLLCGYMWLFIHRPFEVWPWLGDFHIERVYMLATIGFWALFAQKRWNHNWMNIGILLLACAILSSWLMQSDLSIGQHAVENWLKVAVFYILMMSSIRNERDLKILVAAFLVSMSLYMGHSLREYGNGRHVWRMGTARMVGVDLSFNDPNTFAATIAYALPMVLPFWSGVQKRWVRVALLGYIGLSVLCIGLTGSRTGFLILSALVLIFIWCSRRKFLWLSLVSIAAPLLFMLLPADRQDRYWTILDPSRGPANAQTSAESRRILWEKSIDIWKEYPVNGVGPGGFRVFSGTGQQAHTLYGQVISELGTLGVIALGCVLLCFVINRKEMVRLYQHRPDLDRGFTYQLSRAVGIAVVLMLIGGLGGHNLFRYSWLWYGAFQAVALQCARQSLGSAVISSHSYQELRPIRQY